MTIQTKTTEKSWQELTPDEKLEKRLNAWVSAANEIKFASAEAEQNYKASVNRYLNAMLLRKVPDRVPVLPGIGGGFAAHYCGYTEYDMMYDADKASEVAMKCTLEFQTDQKITAAGSPGRAMEALEHKLYRWPGHGLDKDAELQFLEGEYLKENEYDAFIEDPSHFWLRTYLPRIIGAVEPLRMLTYSSAAGGGTITPVLAALSQYGRPEAQAALEKLVKAGKEALAWQQKLAPTNRRLSELGFPTIGGGGSRAPFDEISDSMRGTSGVMTDIYRQPEKLLEAMDRLVPIMIRVGVESARMGGAPVVGFALHKGADGFLSREQFKTFYWGPLKKVCMGLIEEGLVVRMGAQGGYNSRLDIIRDDGLPKGRAIWTLGYSTDMALGKKTIGDVACLQGNLHAGLLHAGTANQVIAECRRLIDVAGKGGGYIFSTANMDKNAKVENVKAMIKCVKEYGVYS